MWPVDGSIFHCLVSLFICMFMFMFYVYVFLMVFLIHFQGTTFRSARGRVPCGALANLCDGGSELRENNHGDGLHDDGIILHCLDKPWRRYLAFFLKQVARRIWAKRCAAVRLR